MGRGDAGGGRVRRLPDLLSVGRLVPDKNFAALIEAIARIGGQAELEIVGTGFLEPDLKDLAARLEAPVRFRGHVPPGELPGLYAAADAYARHVLAPSEEASLGVSFGIAADVKI